MSNKLIINGKEYKDLESIPPEIRALLKASAMDQTINRTIEINNKVYERLEDVPPQYRALLADNDGNGIPDIAEGKISARAIFQVTGLDSVNWRAVITVALLAALSIWLLMGM